MKQLILFDIDHTLIDTAKARRIVGEKLRELLGVSKKRFSETDDKYAAGLEKSTDFNPDEYLAYLAKAFKIEVERIRLVFDEEQEVWQKALFGDVLPALEELGENCRLGIFSEGLVEFQMKKLRGAKILSLFAPQYIFICRRKLVKEALAKIPMGAVIVDDGLNIIKELESKKKFTGVWLNRKSAQKDRGVITIHHLGELKAMEKLGTSSS